MNLMSQGWNPVSAVVSHPDGNALTVHWDVDGFLLSVPAGDRGSAVTVTFTHLFTPGTHTLNITVSDGLASASCQTTLRIEADTTPPSLVCPPHCTVEFQDENGAAVQFPAPEAMDGCAALVVCVPASGSTFPIGNTMVVCTATDAAGNQSTCQFVVTVVGPRQVLEDVAAELARLQASATVAKDRKQLGQTKEYLDQALEPGQWLDATHLVPQHGQRVFQALKEAAQRLEVLTKDKHSQIPDEALQDLIARIVKSVRCLARVDVANGAPSLRAPFYRGRLAQ
jgi:hypothetical protein